MDHELVVMGQVLFPIEHPVNLLIVLALGHFVADFPLQGDRMAVEKCPGRDITLNWRWWITAHAATHGFMVSLLTGVPLLGLAEMGTHLLIDYGKTRLRYSLLLDQVMHLICKVVWTGCLFLAV